MPAENNAPNSNLKPALAVFDLDRTITRFGTYTPFLVRTAFALKPWRLLLAPLVVLAMLGYKAKLLNRKQLKQVMMALLLGRMKRSDVERVGGQFADWICAHHVRPGALAAIAAHRAAGDRLVLATASFEFYAAAIARRLAIDDVIATKSVWQGNILLPRVDGENCYGSAKLDMILAYVGSANVGLVYFYSDDRSDLPVFRWAKAPSVVNPKRSFKRHAEQAGMPVLDWG
jgi:HAD superfamily hydrolase (TIGR01490 family)